MRENAPRAVEEEDPAGRVKQTEQCEEHDIECPERERDPIQAGDGADELVQRQSQHSGAHRYGEPVRRELAYDLGHSAALLRRCSNRGKLADFIHLIVSIRPVPPQIPAATAQPTMSGRTNRANRRLFDLIASWSLPTNLSNRCFVSI